MAYFQSEDGLRCLDRPILLSSRQSPSFTKKTVWSSGVHRGMEIIKIVIFLSPLRNCLPCAVSHNMAYPNNEEFE